MKSFQITHNGQTYSGAYEVDGKLIKVSSAYGSTAGDIAPGTDALNRATLLLSQLVDKWKAGRA